MVWMNALLPMTPSNNLDDPWLPNVKGDKESKFTIFNWTILLNLKAVMCNEREEGQIFANKFKPFDNADTLKMLGVYVLDALSTSLQLVRKMQIQFKEPTHENDLIAKAFSPAYQQLYQSFFHFFGLQDPLLKPPPKQEYTNAKLNEFSKWLCFIWK